MILKLSLLFIFDFQKSEKNMIYFQCFLVQLFQIIVEYTGKSLYPESLMKTSVSFVRLSLVMFKSIHYKS